MGEEAGAGDDCHGDRGRWAPLLPVVVCKGKRSKRQRVHAAPPPPDPEVVIIEATASAEVESSSSIVDDDGWRSGAEGGEEEDMALCLMLLARGGRAGPSSSSVAPDAAESTAATAKEGKFRSRRPADGGGAGEFVYECRTCGRCFPSFQALGGHRTSHKKPRLLLPATTSDEKKRPPAVADERTTPSLSSPSPPSPAPHASADPTALAVPATPPKHEAATMASDVSRQRQRQSGRVHECSICGAEFASGQALGGHMRRHRPLVPASASSSDDAAIGIKEIKGLLELDLNMPAPCDDAAESTSPAAFAFAVKETSPASAFPEPAPALVECHY